SVPKLESGADLHFHHPIGGEPYLLPFFNLPLLAMIPPCDPSILERNPQFKRLYENITKNLLNPDGSTYAHTDDPARRVVVDDLKQCQHQNAKKRIKQHTLKLLAFSLDSGLSDECRDDLALISIYLETPCSGIDTDKPQDSLSQPHAPDDALTLLAPTISSFYTHIPNLITPFSSLLSNTLTTLRALSVSPDTDTTIPAPPATSHQSRARARDRRVRTSLAPLPPLASELRKRVDALRITQLSELPAARRDMAATAAELMSVRAAVLERMVVVLERAKHGTLARAVKARAEHLAVVAQGIEGKVEVAKLEIAATLYTPEVLAALERYRVHLRDTGARLEERKGVALEELKRYGDVEGSERGAELSEYGEEGVLAGIASRYGDLVKEIEDIEIEDMTFDPALQIYTFPCPCGDRFEITIDDLRDGEEIAVCPSCSLMIRVIFDLADLPKADSAQNATVAVQA
ncbi:Uncharacterized protein F1880_001566, partial [Penicillium rolfsii]